MLRRRSQFVATGSSDLPWGLVPNGAAIWLICRRQIRKRRRPPAGWSWPDWWEEIEAVCFARAFEAAREFDPMRRVPIEAFLRIQVHYALSERYRKEARFAAHCRARSVTIREPAKPKENTDDEDLSAARLVLRGLSDSDRALLERLFVEGDSEARLALELGVSQATISRHKWKLLRQLRAQLASDGIIL